MFFRWIIQIISIDTHINRSRLTTGTRRLTPLTARPWSPHYQRQRSPLRLHCCRGKAFLLVGRDSRTLVCVRPSEWCERCYLSLNNSTLLIEKDFYLPPRLLNLFLFTTVEISILMKSIASSQNMYCCHIKLWCSTTSYYTDAAKGRITEIMQNLITVTTLKKQFQSIL